MVGDGVGLQSAVNCLLGGWGDTKLAARLAASETNSGGGAEGELLSHTDVVTLRSSKSQLGKQLYFRKRFAPRSLLSLPARPLLGGCILSVRQTLMVVPAQDGTVSLFYHLHLICFTNQFEMRSYNVQREKYDVL